METIKLILTKFTDETITISSLSLLCITCVLIIYWIYHRRKFHQLTHQIPASVVKNYLDSIIQNSTSLKSSLFRGGGMDLGGGIPSVMPINTLPASSSVATGGASSEELNQKIAEVAALRTQLAEKTHLVTELEGKIVSASGGGGEDREEEILGYKEKIAELEFKLEEALNSKDGGRSELEQELNNVKKERDEYKERLMEYEIIEEDLANLKRLQQENEQLKKALEDSGAAPLAAATTAAAVTATTEVASEKEDDPPPEEILAENAETESIAEEDAVSEETVAASSDTEKIESSGAEEQKSAEELLSEFEKMLG